MEERIELLGFPGLGENICGLGWFVLKIGFEGGGTAGPEARVEEAMGWGGRMHAILVSSLRELFGLEK